MMNKKTDNEVPKQQVVGPVRSNFFTAAMIIIFLMLLTAIISGCTSVILMNPEETGNVAIIPVEGTIMMSSSSRFGSDGADARSIIDNIRRANDDEMVKVIVIEINSGGGAPVASAEIARAVKESNKTTVAWIREVGASGAYWIASAADHVIAHELSTTGSIGVIGSYLQFDQFLADHNVTYNRQVAGLYKDMGSPFKEMTNSEDIMYQKTLSKMHEVFMRNVAENRGLSTIEIKEVSKGQIFLGSDAFEKKLIDEIGGSFEVEAYAKNIINETPKFVRYSEEVGLLDILAGVNSDFAQNVGLGIGHGIVSKNDMSMQI